MRNMRIDLFIYFFSPFEFLTMYVLYEQCMAIGIHDIFFYPSNSMYVFITKSSSGDFTRPEDLDQYIIKAGVGRYSCQLCGYSQSQAGFIRNHVESKHFPNTFTYSCNLCSKTFGTNNAFLWHKRSHK